MGELGRLNAASKVLGSEVGRELGKAGAAKAREASLPLSWSDMGQGVWILQADKGGLCHITAVLCPSSISKGAALISSQLK